MEKAVGMAVSALESTLKNKQQGVLEFDHSPESPLHSFRNKLSKMTADCGGTKSVAIVREAAVAVFLQCQDTYVLDQAAGSMLAEELTRRLINGQCLDLGSVKQQLAHEGISTEATHDAWLEKAFNELYQNAELRQQMEKFVASHGASAPKKVVPVTAAAVNSTDYLAQPMAVLPLADEHAQ
jgi:hypothetical protein